MKNSILERFALRSSSVPVGLALATLPALAQTTWVHEKILAGDDRGEMVRHKGLEQVLWVSSMFDPTEIFSWDGTRWDLVESVTPGPSRRQDFGVAYDSDREVLVLHGGVNPAGVSYRETWEWSTTTGWTQISTRNQPNARTLVAMAYDEAQGKTVLFGGVNPNGLIRGTTWLWDGVDWRRDDRTPLPAKRHTRMVYDEARQKCVIYGGQPEPGITVNNTWEYDASGWVKRTYATSPGSSIEPGMAYDPLSARTILYGGTGGTATKCWAWDGMDWAPIPNPQVAPNWPGIRHGPGLAFDAARGEMVLFGGRSSVRDAETHVLDSQGWSFRSVIAPQAQSAHAMTYDPVRDRVVLFGGSDGVFSFGKGYTFEWDGHSWTDMTVALSPPARWGASFTYDPIRDRSVLFGGYVFNGTQPLKVWGDTWEWNGATWTQIGVTGPMAARQGAAMVFDPAIGGPLLFGGLTNYLAPPGIALDETWQLVGHDWAQLTPTSSPPARYNAAIGRDPVSGEVLLYGGSNETDDLGDTWAWTGDWTQLTPTTPSPVLEQPCMTYDQHRSRLVMVGVTSLGQQETWEWLDGDWSLRTSSPCAPTSPFVSPIEYHAGTQRIVRHWIDGCSTLDPLGITQTYGPDDPASLMSYGQGCAGTLGVPVLDSDPAAAWLGEEFTLRVSGIPAGGSAFPILGGSMTGWGANPLPFSLSPWGLTGCLLYVRPDRSINLIAAGPGAAERTMFAPLSQAATLAGYPFYVQGVVVDPGANPAGMVLSNALAGVLGVK